MQNMNVTNITISKIAEDKTNNASYRLEYSIMDGVLGHVQASVSKPEGEEVIGSISYEYGNVTANLPFTSEIPLYLTDFYGYVKDILANVEKEVKDCFQDDIETLSMNQN